MVEKEVTKESDLNFSEENFVNQIDSHLLPFCALRFTGRNHQTNNLLCQDAFASWRGTVNNSEVAIYAIGDGHGDRQYDLSQFGSFFAVESAIEVLKDIYIKFSNSRDQLWKEIKYTFPRMIFRNWKKKVENHFKQSYSCDDFTVNTIQRYGTTLLFAVVSPEGLFYGQLGDGDIVIIENQEKIHHDITHVELIGNETYSLSSNNSAKMWKIKTHTIAEDAFLFLSTDGLSNSFVNDESFFKFLKSLVKNYSEFAFSIINPILADKLKLATEAGSMDDITLLFQPMHPQYFKVK